MEDVIFNGTQKAQAQGYCEVSLVFENEDHALSVDYTEVMITRRVYRSGEANTTSTNPRAGSRISSSFSAIRAWARRAIRSSASRIDEILSPKRARDRRGVLKRRRALSPHAQGGEEKRLSNMRDNLSRVEDMVIAELESQLGAAGKVPAKPARRYP